MKPIRDRRRLERYQAVSMMLQGYSYAVIGQIMRQSVTTVWQYVQTHRTGCKPSQKGRLRLGGGRN